MAEEKGVLVIGEAADEGIALVTREVLAAGRDLADALGEELGVVLMGGSLGNLSQGIGFGADKVYALEHSLLQEYQTDAYLAVLHPLCKDLSPRIILLAQSITGRELGPRLAFRLGSVLLQECTELCLDPDTRELQGNRPVYGGSAMATVVSHSAPHMAALRPRVYQPLDRDDARQGEVVSVDVELDEGVIRTRLLERVEEPTADVRLEDASIVVSGGRGLGGPEPFQQLEELAKLLGGAVGASRAACDAGWVPASYQVGLTGKTITPDLYITVGISGASQHMAGCGGAKIIVAINKDAEANIFREARYGVAGDWQKILPAFMEQVRELMK